MPNVNQTQMNFVGGELGPSVRARSDIKVYASGCERLENFLLETTGPAKYRTGTMFVNHTRRNAIARLIPFQFSDIQAYLIECTPGYFRFYKDGGVIVDSDKTITGISKANPCVVTSTAHGYANGDEVFINGVVGPDKLNGKSFIVANVATNTFELQDEDGNAIDSSAYDAYVSGGVASKIIEITHPYKDVTGMSDEEVMDYLRKIQFSQNADTMYFVHPGYEPRKLTRSSHTSWTFATFTRTNDPFTGAGNYPVSVCFDGAGRLVYGGTENDPEKIVMSRGPDSSTGASRYDDFTKGNLANDALTIFLAPSLGKVDSIQWLTANNKFFLVGTFSGIRRIVSSDGVDSAFSATTGVVVKPIDSFGCEVAKPVPKGNQLFYIQRGGQILRSLEYDLVYDSYKSVDKNLVSDAITYGGLRESVFQYGRPDVIWNVRKDGKLLGVTYHESEDVAGWHRQILGGNGKVLSAGIMLRATEYDQLWLVVERGINGKTRRQIEYFSDYQTFLLPEDFYGDETTEEADKLRFNNDMFERQKLEVHLDCAMSYDGSQLGIDKNATISIGTVTDSIATFTSSVDIFKATHLDRQIWRIHDHGNGSGRASIVEYIDAKNVKCKILKDFDITSLAPGSWTLTTDSVSGLEHLEGQEVGVLTDGAVHNNRTVLNGSVKLDAQADVIHVGFRYRGLLKSMNINAGGVSGSAQNKPRNVYKVIFEFMNTLGVKFGTSLYKLTKLNFRSASDYTNRPSPLFTGSEDKRYEDRTQRRKYVYVIQDSPLPCTVQAIDIYAETVDEQG